MSMPTHAMVLAAGRGERMRPITETTPKPLVKVAGRAMLDRVFDHLDAVRVPHRVVNTHWLAAKIAVHLAHTPGVILSNEETLLETGGGVARALPLLGPAAFFVCNADIVWIDGARPALLRLAGLWDESRMDALLLMQHVDRAFGYLGVGDYFLDAEGGLKRRSPSGRAPFVFTGVQILHPRLFKDVPGGPFSLNILYDRAEQAGRLFGLAHDGEWLHIGTPQALAAAEIHLAEHRG